MPRWLKFLLALLVGLVAGLVYGWFVSPVKYVNTTPEILSMDYRTDMVLMTAEHYASSLDVTAAARSLESQFRQSPAITAADALVYAQASNYSASDITLLQNLFIALQAAQPRVSP
jgi:hypothetical protein